MNVQTTDPQSVVQEISLRLNQAMQEGSVLWLLSGGSNIELAVRIRQELDIQNDLTVGLIDERYGPVGHPDSNWQQLLDAGFDENDISIIPVLTGKDLKNETSRYKHELKAAIESHKTIIGIFGMGSDGHTSGVLPESPVIGTNELVASYHGPDFDRITTTPVSFKHFDVAYLVAFGDSKQQQLLQLIHRELSVGHQPAQALKNAKELFIYSDQILSKGL